MSAGGWRTDLRWFAKKTARRGVALTSSVVRSSLPMSPGVRVLTYHRFGDVPRDPFCVPPKVFEEQVRWLTGEGLAVSLKDVVAYARGQVELRTNSALITIDDGCLSTFELALPILERHRVPSVAFVTSSLVGSGDLGLSERYVTWAELRECVRRGMEVGSHAHSHRSLGQLSIADAEREAVESRTQLQKELGPVVSSFAYPFGTHGDFTQATETVLQRAGYEVAFNSQHGAVRPRAPLFSLPRVKVEGGEGLTMFRMLVAGSMDAWRHIDKNLWRLQRVRREISLE